MTFTTRQHAESAQTLALLCTACSPTDWPVAVKHVGAIGQPHQQELRTVRLGMDLEQGELARRASVSRTAVSTLENGRGSSLSTVIKLARVLNLDDWMDGIAADETIPSPLEQFAAARRQRRPQLRVSQRVR
ncbi:helix-turn-helix transcriptional regulator [Aeromicrobium sp.]|uniref:helix-turn-helix transcriptional regulator n=1 Tax=Aeromicrobium sp. TaxID=1871063 RepID=UPI001992D253|nr:helix-turn-helix transcriptional regulator [Aeromicrobium sp.]MBC7631882.1 helix-turn-helix transcriptional regulator [Aeromicrobium sp.]